MFGLLVDVLMDFLRLSGSFGVEESAGVSEGLLPSAEHWSSAGIPEWSR